jgi:hypothetical protein
MAFSLLQSPIPVLSRRRPPLPAPSARAAGVLVGGAEVLVCRLSARGRRDWAGASLCDRMCPPSRAGTVPGGQPEIPGDRLPTRPRAAGATPGMVRYVTYKIYYLW